MIMENILWRTMTEWEPIPAIFYQMQEKKITVNTKARVLLKEGGAKQDELNKVFSSLAARNAEECIYSVQRIGNRHLLISCYKIHGEGNFLITLQDLNKIKTLIPESKVNDEIEKELDCILESTHDDLLITDGQGVILKVSSSFENIYGVNRREVLGKTVYELEERGIFRPSVTVQVLKTKEKVTMLQRNQFNRQIVVTATPVKDEKGQIIKVVSFSRDITEFITLKEQYSMLENKIQRYTAELEELRNKSLNLSGVVGKAKSIQKVLHTLNKVADFDANLLFIGESGVGKTMFARITHSRSKRAKGPFIEINCGAIPENLLESELFGYEGGSFTGSRRDGKIGLIELAHNGTLFLDEISELPLSLQVKLLKVIQDKTLTRVGGTKSIKVDFRLIAATNKDLNDLVERRVFREDLFYRLNVVTLLVPPLRERREDIIPLCLHFVEKFNRKYKFHKVLAPAVLDRLCYYEWPGNIRELENVIERILLTSDHDMVTEDFLPENIKTCQGSGNSEEGMSLSQALESLERKLILKALAKYNTTVGVAQALGISQPTATRKIRKYKGIHK